MNLCYVGPIGLAAPLFCSLRRRGHTVHTSLVESPDIYFVGFRAKHKHDEETIKAINSTDSPVFAVALTDNGLTSCLVSNQLNEFRKIDFLITNTINEPSDKHFRDKTVLIPKFTINRIDQKHFSADKSGIFFRGTYTGPKKYVTWRSDMVKVMSESRLWVQCEVVLFPLKEEGIKKASVNLSPRSSRLEKSDYLDRLGRCQISLCPPGNVTWCYRHLESMALGANIISLPVSGEGRFMFQECLDDCFNLVEPDFSDLIDVCESILGDPNKYESKRELALETYQNYLELDPLGGYNQKVLRLILDSIRLVSGIML
jgi:hypothetical protein